MPSSREGLHNARRIKPMNNMAKARAVLAALARCTAKSRQRGVACKNPHLGAGGKCRFHGGASTGRPPTHGRLTKANLLNRDWVRLLLGELAIEHPGFKVSWFNTGSMTLARCNAVLDVKLKTTCNEFEASDDHLEVKT